MPSSILRSVAVLFIAAPAFGIGAPCFCPSDLDGSGDTGFADLLEVLSSWGPCAPCAADLDGNGLVEFTDVLDVLSNWGPCVFAYDPPREDAEAEQIGLEMLGSIGPLLLPDATYERVDRDLDLIRAARPELMDQPHTLAWAPNMLILQKVDGVPTDAYDALNACLQLVSEENFAFDFWLLTFPGKINVARLETMYEALDSVQFAQPNELLGGENDWSVVPMIDASWRWTIDDGWHDCFDGCDCHRVYTIDIDEAGALTIVSIEEFLLPWCESDK